MWIIRIHLDSLKENIPTDFRYHKAPGNSTDIDKAFASDYTYQIYGENTICLLIRRPAFYHPSLQTINLSLGFYHLLCLIPKFSKRTLFLGLWNHNICVSMIFITLISLAISRYICINNFLQIRNSVVQKSDMALFSPVLYQIRSRKSYLHILFLSRWPDNYGEPNSVCT